MNVDKLKRTVKPLVLTCSLLAGVVIVSVATGHAQGRHGGGSESHSGGGGGRSSGGSSHSSSSHSSSGRSSSDHSSSRSSSDHSRSGRSRGSDDSGHAHRERGGDDSARSSGSSSPTWRHHHGRDHDHDHDRDHDRDRDHHREHKHRRDRDRDDRYRAYHNTRVYQSSNYGGYGYSSNAYERGYQDGLHTGAKDAQRGQSYDPERSHFYQHGTSGFFSIFGSRGTYQQAYRDGFLRGYEEGYQHYESYFTGGHFHR